MNNKELMGATMTSYDYYIGIAKAIVKELEQGREGHLSLRYVDSKVEVLKEFTDQMRIAIARQEE